MGFLGGGWLVEAVDGHWAGRQLLPRLEKTGFDAAEVRNLFQGQDF
jgi:hypothetical protein